MLLGPGSGMTEYSGHPLVGTAGVPLVVYPGLKVGTATLRRCYTRDDYLMSSSTSCDPNSCVQSGIS